MKNERKTNQDLEMLSAYLDNALTPAERQTLEAQLIRDPALRTQLENLKTTRKMIRSLPRLKAPRNFTLSPEMVKTYRQKPKPLFSFVRLVTSAAALLLVVLFGLELLTGTPPLAAPPIADAPRQTLDEATPAPLIIWGGPGMGGGQAEGVGGAAAESMPQAIEREPAQPEFPEAQPPDMAYPPTFKEEDPTPEIPSSPAEDDALPILGLNLDEGGEIVDRSETIEDEGAPALPGIRWVQIGLMAIALGGGATWLILKKNQG